MKLEDLIYNTKMVSFSDYQNQSLDRQLRVFRVPSYTISSTLVNVTASFIRHSWTDIVVSYGGIGFSHIQGQGHLYDSNICGSPMHLGNINANSLRIFMVSLHITIKGKKAT